MTMNNSGSGLIQQHNRTFSTAPAIRRRRRSYHVALYIFLGCSIAVILLSYINNGMISHDGSNNHRLSSFTNYFIKNEQPAVESMITHKANSKKVLLMSQNSRQVVDLVRDCAFDKDNNCQLSYLHLQKTGGSHVAAQLFSLYNQTYQSKEWCCFDKFTTQFHNNLSNYCQRPVASYEVNPFQFSDIIETCRQRQRQSSAFSFQYLPLVTIRDPIRQTLSMIHHQCNKNHYKKNSSIQQICQRCKYDGGDGNSSSSNATTDQQYWDTFLVQTNTIYLQLREYIMHLLQQPDNDNNNDDMIRPPLLIVDNAYIDWFVEELLQGNTTTASSKRRTNRESTHICNFGMTSTMMHKLAPALGVYYRIQTL